MSTKSRQSLGLFLLSNLKSDRNLGEWRLALAKLKLSDQTIEKILSQFESDFLSIEGLFETIGDLPSLFEENYEPGNEPEYCLEKTTKLGLFVREFRVRFQVLTFEQTVAIVEQNQAFVQQRSQGKTENLFEHFLSHVHQQNFFEGQNALRGYLDTLMLKTTKSLNSAVPETTGVNPANKANLGWNSLLLSMLHSQFGHEMGILATQESLRHAIEMKDSSFMLIGMWWIILQQQRQHHQLVTMKNIDSNSPQKPKLDQNLKKLGWNTIASFFCNRIIPILTGLPIRPMILHESLLFLARLFAEECEDEARNNISSSSFSSNGVVPWQTLDRMLPPLVGNWWEPQLWKELLEIRHQRLAEIFSSCSLPLLAHLFSPQKYLWEELTHFTPGIHSRNSLIVGTASNVAGNGPFLGSSSLLKLLSKNHQLFHFQPLYCMSLPRALHLNLPKFQSKYLQARNALQSVAISNNLQSNNIDHLLKQCARLFQETITQLWNYCKEHNILESVELLQVVKESAYFQARIYHQLGASSLRDNAASFALAPTLLTPSLAPPSCT